jgi:hypothetical protein
MLWLSPASKSRVQRSSKFNGGRLSGATVSAHLMPQVLTLAV